VIAQSSIEVVEDAIRRLGERVELYVLRSATATNIQAKLQEMQPHVLHIIAHGVDGEIILVSEDKKSMRSVNADAFSQLLANRSSVRLVLLNVCQSASGMAGGAFAGIGPALIARRVPAVVAMQYGSVLLETASQFAQAFYAALSNNIQIGAAVNEARQRISMEELGDRDWSTPVLYLSTKTKPIIEVTTSPKPGPLPHVWREELSGLPKDAQRDFARRFQVLRQATALVFNLSELEQRVRDLMAQPADVNALEDQLARCEGLLGLLQTVGNVPELGANELARNSVNIKDISASLVTIGRAGSDSAVNLDRECRKLLRMIYRAQMAWRDVMNWHIDDALKTIDRMTTGAI